jgi:transcriptional regulator with XRE-family HTH domain
MMPMGYRGKTTEQNRARDLRAQGWTYNEICAEVGVSKSSVSLWCRDIPVDRDVWARKLRESRRFGARTRVNSLAVRRQQQIDQLRVAGRERVGRLSEEAFLVAGAALYAGEGSKTDGAVKFANSDPRMILFFISWLRHFFSVDESRLRLRLYLHVGLDLVAAQIFWSALTDIPIDQFTRPYRAVPDPSIRRAKHPMGCPSIGYSCSETHRAVMGLVDALLSCSDSLPG